MEGKANFSARLKQFDGLTWLTPTPPPLFYDSCTQLNSSALEVLCDLCAIQIDIYGGMGKRKGSETSAFGLDFVHAAFDETGWPRLFHLFHADLPS